MFCCLYIDKHSVFFLVGNDEKISFDETGKTVTHPPGKGKDTVSIIDIREPTKPRIVANLPLMNTVTGPPVNLAITPDQHLALVANSLDWVKDGEGWNGGRRSSAISQGSRLISSSPNSS
jgi:hypothetical protein